MDGITLNRLIPVMDWMMDITGVTGLLVKNFVNPKELIWLPFIVLKRQNFFQVKHLILLHFGCYYFLGFGYVVGYYFWTGLYSNDNELTWKWSDNTPFDYLPWASGYPSLNASSCGYLPGNGILGQLLDLNCATNMYILCKKAVPLKQPN